MFILALPVAAADPCDLDTPRTGSAGWPSRLGPAPVASIRRAGPVGGGPNHNLCMHAYAKRARCWGRVYCCLCARGGGKRVP